MTTYLPIICAATICFPFGWLIWKARSEARKCSLNAGVPETGSGRSHYRWVRLRCKWHPLKARIRDGEPTNEIEGLVRFQLTRQHSGNPFARELTPALAARIKRRIAVRLSARSPLRGNTETSQQNGREGLELSRLLLANTLKQI